jgi:hypothetical protein
MYRRERFCLNRNLRFEQPNSLQRGQADAVRTRKMKGTPCATTATQVLVSSDAFRCFNKESWPSSGNATTGVGAVLIGEPEYYIYHGDDELAWGKSECCSPVAARARFSQELSNLKREKAFMNNNQRGIAVNPVVWALVG